MHKSQVQFSGPEAMTLESEVEAKEDRRGRRARVYEGPDTRCLPRGSNHAADSGGGGRRNSLISPLISSHPRLPTHSTLRGPLQPTDRNSLASCISSFFFHASSPLFILAACIFSLEKIRHVCSASTREHCDYVRRESRR